MTVVSMIIKNPWVLLKWQFFPLSHRQHLWDVEFLIPAICPTKITLNTKEPKQDNLWVKTAILKAVIQWRK